MTWNPCSKRRLQIVRELETDGRAAALQRSPAFVELAAVEMEGYLSFRCIWTVACRRPYLDPAWLPSSCYMTRPPLSEAYKLPTIGNYRGNLVATAHV